MIVGGEERLGDAVMLIQGGPGAFAPGEVEASRLLRLGDAVAAPQIDRIRVGRPGDS